MTIAQTISKLMSDNNCSQTTLAKALNIRQATVSSWATGRTSPDAEDIRRIKQYFGVSYDYIFGEITEKNFSSNDDNIEDPHPSNHIIAYLDLLGSQERMAHEDNYFEKLYSMVQSGIAIVEKYNSKCLTNVKIKAFSDNIVFALKYTPENFHDKVNQIIALVAVFQGYALEKTFPMRGCLTVGEFFADNFFVYGNGLIDAYKNEKTIAIYPRVILSQTIIKAFKKYAFSLEVGFIRDCDGEYYIDFKSRLDNKQVEIIKNFVNKEYAKYNNSKDERIAMKYYWLGTNNSSFNNVGNSYSGSKYTVINGDNNQLSPLSEIQTIYDTLSETQQKKLLLYAYKLKLQIEDE